MSKVTSRLPLDSGRSRQKQRTKSALVAAARELIARGATPTVEDAALAAQISRTTAYRYFGSQAELLAAAHPETVKESLLPARAPASVEARVDAVVKELTRIVRDSEAQQRTMLRLSLDPTIRPETLVLRQGRAIKWIEEALEPLGWRSADRRRVAIAIRSATGIESFVWLVDVAGLSRNEAVKTMRWSARALLAAARAERS
jgi:AcrR family transcriptional regulator